jgi:hypothetical protein
MVCVLLVFGAPCQLRLLAGQEHGRTIPLAEVGCLAASSVWTAVRAIARCGWFRYVALTVKAEEPFRMNESIHGECTASELQDQLTELRGRVTGLIEQQTAISDLRAGS